MSDDKVKDDKKKEDDKVVKRKIIGIALLLLISATMLMVSINALYGIVTHTSLDKSFIGVVFGVVIFAAAFLAYLGDSGNSTFSAGMKKVVLATTAIINGVAEMWLPIGGVEVGFRRPGSSDASKADEQVILCDEDRARLISELEQKIKLAAAEDAFRDDILQRVEKIQRNSAEVNRLQTIDAQFNAARSRLDQAIALLHRKANINMLVGILLSALGIFFLGITVVPGLFNRIFMLPSDFLQNSESLSNITQFWMHYLPRVTLAVVLELFAYFFLNLYKANAAETRYYHNEITNISSRHSALMAASDPRDPELLKLVISDLLKTERNGVLTKTQTTVEIARAKAEAESSKNLVSVVTKLVESFGRVSGKTEGKE